MNKDIHFILTGGTIDSVFDPSADAVIVNKASVISEFIENKILPHADFSYEVLTMKDSRDITDHIREEIIRSITKCEKKNIVITHGTYTMAETACYLDGKTPPDKTIILTGSMFPLKGFSDSDAPFNLGFAIASAMALPSGIYIAMNGTVFKAQEALKDLKKARFTFKK
ncbi:MAG: asparaginase [Alphaproteobacteria bacterium]|nr:asparaginase [Alphaproteobacteria bacterium]